MRKTRFFTRLRARLVAAVLSITLLFGAMPAHAQFGIPNITGLDIPRILEWAGTFSATVLETIGYKMLKSGLDKIGRDAALAAFGEFSGEGKGQEPLFWETPWQYHLVSAVDQAQGFFIDGIAAGIDTANQGASTKDRIAAKKTELDNEINSLRADVSTDCEAISEIDGGQDIDQAKYDECMAKKEAAQVQLKQAEGNLSSLASLENAKAQQASAKTQQQANVQGGYPESTRRIIDTLCNPSLSARLNIVLSFVKPPVAAKPVCTWKQFTENWSNAVKSTGIEDLIAGKGPNGWAMLKGMIDPAGSEVAVSYGLYTNYLELLAEKERNEILKRLGKDVKAKEDLAGWIKTPGSLIEEGVKKNLIEGPLKNSTSPVLTGKLAADLGNLVGSFVDSFASKAQDLVWKGIVKRAGGSAVAVGGGFGTGDGGSGFEALYNPESSPNYSGQQATQVARAQLAKLDYSRAPENIDVLSELQQDSECELNPRYCVIGSGFSQAIQERLTVREAIKKKLINEDAYFGFKAGPVIIDDYKTNFPYSSLVVLRRYRVIPVGWEIAALYMRDNTQACGALSDCRLRDVLGGFGDPTSPFYRLVDENWVLKLPAVQCALTGYGPITNAGEKKEICRTDTNKDGVVCCEVSCMSVQSKKKCKGGHSGMTLSRWKEINEYGQPLTETEYENCQGNIPGRALTDLLLDAHDVVYFRTKTCLDERSCLSEDADGSCKKGAESYGYCLEERTRVVFPGTECKEAFNSCLGFTDKETGQTRYLLKDTIPDFSLNDPNNRCNSTVAGCKWYSSRQYSRSTPQIPDWSDADADKVYLTASAPRCPSEQAGCTTLSGGTASAYRLAPSEWSCDSPEGYRRKECRDYLLHCGNEQKNYTGCAAYTPTNRDPQVAGTSPIACSPGCVDITNYLEKRSAIEEILSDAPRAEFLNFVASSAAQCREEHAGCEEFTDLQKEQEDRGSGERLVAYSQLVACKARGKAPDPDQVFYSWFGSDEKGSRLEKYEFEDDGSTDNPQPKCAFERTDCGCTFNTADDTKNHDDRRGDCRDFINSKGTAKTYWTNLLVPIRDASECRSFRRTADEKTYTFSTQLSRSCPLAATRCHEYRSPRAANQQVILSETFDNQETSEWRVGTQEGDRAAISKDTETLPIETLNQRSLRVNGASVWRLLPGSIGASTTSTVEFVIKADTQTTVGVSFVNAENQQSGTSLSTLTSDEGGSAQVNGGVWKQMKFYVSPAVTGQQWLSITTSGSVPFTLDRIIVKHTDGVAFVLKDTWQTSGEQCKNEDETIQYSCQEYADSTGKRSTLQGFAQLCPMQLVGCKEFTVPGEKTRLIDDHLDEETTVPTPTTAGWTYSANNSVAELVVDGSLKVNASEATASNSAFVQKQIQLKGGSAYTLTFRMRNATSGSKPVEKMKAQLLAQGSFSPLFDGTAQEYNDSTNDYHPWQNFSFSIPALTADQAGLLRIIPESQVLSFSYELDDIELTLETGQKKIYLVDEGQKSCEARYAGCTMYGAPTLDNAGKPKSWSTVTYLIPKSKALSGASQTGICSEKSLNCKEYRYNNGGGSPVYFQDPLNRICQPVQDGNEIKFERKLCENNSNVVCTEHKDCGTNAIGAAISTCKVVDCPHIDPNRRLEDPTEQFWVKSCPQEANTCRLIEDPECGANGFLRTNYGRGTVRVPCKPKYYYLSDVSGKGCQNGVNVDKGCLLFKDARVAANSMKFNSTKYYEEYWNKYRNNDLSLDVAATDATGPGFERNAPAQGTLDANAVLKVRYDRECKTRLDCNIYDLINNTIVCQEVRPCVTEDSTGTCPLEGAINRRLPGETRSALKSQMEESLKGRFIAPVAAITTPPDLSFMFLSGFSRPNFDFGDIFTGGKPSFSDGVASNPATPTRTYNSTSTYSGGHDGYFDWVQNQLADAVGAGESEPWVLDTALGYPETSTLSSLRQQVLEVPSGTLRTTNSEIVHSCRVLPGDAPSEYVHPFSGTKQVDACSAATKKSLYKGIYGFCLEPNPKPKANRQTASFNGGARTLATYRQSVNQSLYAQNSVGYADACLTWHPTDQTDYQRLSELDLKGGDFDPPTEPVYYCLKVDQTPIDDQDLPGCPNSNYTDKGKTCEIEKNTAINVRNAGQDYVVLKRCGNAATKAELIARGTILGAAGCVAATGSGPGILIACPSSIAGGVLAGFVASLFAADGMQVKFHNDQESVCMQPDAFAGNTAIITPHIRSKEHKYSSAAHYGLMPANDFEKTIKKADIDSIEYKLEGALVDLEGKDPLRQTKKPNEIVGWGDQKAYDNAYWDGGDVDSYGQCGNGATFLIVKPHFNSSDVFDGWDWALCDEDGQNDDIEVALVGAKFNLKYTVVATKRSRETPVQYCSEIVQLARVNTGVSAGAVLSHSLGFKESDKDKIVKINQSSIHRWHDVDDKYNGIGGAVLGNAPESYTSITNGSTGSVDYNSGITISAHPLTQQGNDPEYATKYYAKPYEYWEWQGNGYRKVASYSTSYRLKPSECTPAGARCNEIVDAWTALRRTAVSPEITMLDVKLAGGQNAASGGQQINRSSSRVQLEFNITYNSNTRKQLPIRFLGVNRDADNSQITLASPSLPAGYGINPFVDSPIDGKGRDIISSNLNSSISTKAFVRGYTYASPDGKRICIIAIDNWGAWGRACGRISFNGRALSFTQDVLPPSESAGKEATYVP